MTENHQGRFHASHVQTAPCERRALQYSKIRNILRSPDHKEELLAKIFRINSESKLLLNTLCVFVGMKCSVQVASLPHRLTWSAIAAEWTPHTALLHGNKELTFLVVVVPGGPGNQDPRERIRTSLQPGDLMDSWKGARGLPPLRAWGSGPQREDQDLSLAWLLCCCCVIMFSLGESSRWVSPLVQRGSQRDSRNVLNRSRTRKNPFF